MINKYTHAETWNACVALYAPSFSHPHPRIIYGTHAVVVDASCEQQDGGAISSARYHIIIETVTFTIAPNEICFYDAEVDAFAPSSDVFPTFFTLFVLLIFRSRRRIFSFCFVSLFFDDCRLLV